MKERILADLNRIYEHKQQRMDHVLGVRDTALRLGKLHHCDLDKLELAALLHDITKYDSHEQNVKRIRSYYENADSIIREYNPNILHAFSAVAVAHDAYGVTDPDILGAIEKHTIGAPNMSMMEAVLFVSDYIEPNRTYPSCIHVRSIAFENLHLAIYTAMDDSIRYFESTEGQVPQTAYKARAYYKNQLEESM